MSVAKTGRSTIHISIPIPVPSSRCQFAEKQEAERRAKEEEEEERQRREAEEAEEALRKQPKSKVEQVRDLLTSKLSERVELCGELLVLLRRAQKKVREMTGESGKINWFWSLCTPRIGM